MKITQISKKLIKPFTPTPQNLKNYSISFLDNCMEQMNFSIILFYKSKPVNITHLEESLAKTLVQFYPLAGRYIKNDHIVDCSDQGVEFIEVEAQEVKLLDLIAKIETEQLNALLPDQYLQLDEADPVLGIKVTRFCGDGVSISVSVRHTVFDMSSLGAFIAAWSGVGPAPAAASFDLPLLLPYKHHDFDIATENFSCMDGNLVVKRLVFDKAALTRLRSKLRSNHGGEKVSRVRVVCAVIAKALIRLDIDRERDFLIVQGINMRERTIPPLPKHSCGNLAILSDEYLPSSEGKKMGLQELVDLIGDSALKRIGECSGILSPNGNGRDIIINTYTKVFKQMGDPSLKSIIFTDWSKFGFYEADFGWGKPVWASVGPMRTQAATTILMSNKEGNGIEAWVHLDRNEMHRFEQDKEIKLFAI